MNAALKVEEVSISMIRTYEHELRDPGVSKKYRQFKFGMLKEQEGFNAWKDCDRSALLVLDGRTLKAGRDNSDKFWASTAVFDLLKILDKHENPVIYYFIEPDESMVYDVPTHKIFSHLIWQILSHAPHLTRDAAHMKEIRELASGEHWQTREPKLPCEMIKKLLAHIPSTFILLDRIDRCACAPTNLIDSLLGLVRDCRGRVKIFSTFDERSGKALSVESLDLTSVESQFMHVTLDQRKGHGNLGAREDDGTL